MDIQKAQPLLDYINKHVSLTKEEESTLLSHITFRKYLKGQYILQQGDICRYECYVISGCTKTFYLDDDGQEHIIMFSIEDWWAADMGSFIDQTPADFNIQCLENTELVMFSYDTIEDLYIKVPKLERFFRRIIEKAFIASQQRIPQYMIASYLGITKEFLSKIKSQLALE